MKKTKVTQVLIEEGWVEKKGKIYWKWRFNGQGRWNYRLTPYKELPYTIFKPAL